MSLGWSVVGVAFLAGCAGGLVHAGFGAAFTVPYIEAAIGIETSMMLESGGGTPEFWESLESYREWQRQGSTVASFVLGIALASLFCMMYLFLWRGPMPGGVVGGALILGVLMWGALFMVPFLKYPAMPPGVGDPETIGERTLAYVALVAISGAAAVAAAISAWIASDRLGRARIPVAAAGYAAAMAAAFALFPAPEEVGLPQDLVDGFRVASALAMLSFWLSVGASAGLLWRRLYAR